MNEDFLHYVWKYRLFDQAELKTTQGEPIEILNPGEHNLHAGPDFSDSRIRTGNTLWAGNVEIHLKASDWNRHFHQEDAAYNNVILHVVLEADEEVKTAKGVVLPVLELKYRVLPHVLGNYQRFGAEKSDFPCARLIAGTPPVILNSWLERMVIERLENKTAAIKKNLEQNSNNWEETFYLLLAQNFGFKTNAQPFAQLARLLPLSIAGKHRNNLFQLEALLFGQAGMLEEQFNDKYPADLQNEYAFLRHKYSLQPLPKELWKFLRMRPANFPTLRIAGFAALLHSTSYLFSVVMETRKLTELQSFFSAQASAYWETHYLFDVPSAPKEKRLGKEAVNTIIINTVVPFLFIYGKQKKEESWCSRALALLEELGPEDNLILKKFSRNGISAKNSLDSQAIIQLNNTYCKDKKCLHCSVGNHLLSKT